MTIKERMTAKERMYLNKHQDALFPEGHPESAFLYATPGTVIPESAAEMFSIRNGKMTKKSGVRKAARKAQDKAKKPEANKGGLTVTFESKRI